MEAPPLLRKGMTNEGFFSVGVDLDGRAGGCDGSLARRLPDHFRAVSG